MSSTVIVTRANPFFMFLAQRLTRSAKLQENDRFIRQLGPVKVSNIFALNSFRTVSFRCNSPRFAKHYATIVVVQLRLLQEEVGSSDQHGNHATTSALRNADEGSNSRTSQRSFGNVAIGVFRVRMDCVLVSGTLGKTRATLLVTVAFVCTTMQSFSRVGLRDGHVPTDLVRFRRLAR